MSNKYRLKSFLVAVVVKSYHRHVGQCRGRATAKRVTLDATIEAPLLEFKRGCVGFCVAFHCEQIGNPSSTCYIRSIAWW